MYEVSKTTHCAIEQLQLTQLTDLGSRSRCSKFFNMPFVNMQRFLDVVFIFSL